MVERKPSDATLFGLDFTDVARWQRDLIKLLILVVISLAALACVLIMLLWPMSDEDWDHLRFPTTLAQAKSLGVVLNRFKDDHYYRTLAGHAACYLFLQAFAIPGTTIFNLLAGALFGVIVGFVTSITLSVLGSIILYEVSRHLGSRTVKHFFHQRLRSFQAWIQEDEHHLTARIIGIRVFPFTPNWFVNIACGQLGVPMRIYIPATLIGLAPYTFVGNQAGTILPRLQSTKEILQPEVMWGLIALAVVGVGLPTLLKRMKFAPNNRR
eukprot:TRINITY_DN8765_c0_g1_i2.p1 TRINITY_DN8765_c0_g1~~TRINITY_DN8765_c0_g1_i2.p1  ORF type:complete len:268 (+),score=29.32 TRINITY_DN8765_c0_g1_i2:106-909(+)